MIQKLFVANETPGRFLARAGTVAPATVIMDEMTGRCGRGGWR